MMRIALPMKMLEVDVVVCQNGALVGTRIGKDFRFFDNLTVPVSLVRFRECSVRSRPGAQCNTPRLRASHPA
jgi:hypothetical protein